MRTAALATAAAVTGVVAAMIVALSIHHATTTPAVYGAGWDLLLQGVGDDHLTAGVVDEAALTDDESFSAVTEVIDDLEVVVDDVRSSAIAVDDLRGHTPFVTVRGVEPRGIDEVGLGADTLADLGVGLGDTVTVDAGQPRQMTVVGVVAMPVSVDGGSNRQGVALTLAAAESAGFADDCDDDDVECSRNYALAATPGSISPRRSSRTSSTARWVRSTRPPRATSTGCPRSRRRRRSSPDYWR